MKPVILIPVLCLLLAGAASAADTTIRQLQKPVTGVGKVVSPQSTSGGKPAETVDKAERRVPSTIRHRNRAVTTKDYKKISTPAPGTRVHRVRVQPAKKKYKSRKRYNPGPIKIKK